MGLLGSLGFGEVVWVSLWRRFGDVAFPCYPETFRTIPGGLFGGGVEWTLDSGWAADMSRGYLYPW